MSQRFLIIQKNSASLILSITCSDVKESALSVESFANAASILVKVFF